MGTVSNPRIWCSSTTAISLENWPALQVTGSGKTVVSSTSTILYAGTYLDA